MKQKTIERFKKMVKPYKKTILIVTLMALFIDICELVKPYLLEQVMDKYLPEKLYIYNNISITTIAVIYILIVIMGNIVDYINRITTNNMGEKVMYNLRNQLYKYIEKSNVTFHDKTPSGKLYVRVTSDTEDVYALFSEVITTFPKDIIIILGLLTMMIYMSIQLSAINILIIPLLLVVTITISKILKKIFNRSKEYRTVLNTFLAESIYGIKLIKIFNRQKEKQEECEENTKNYRNSSKNIGVLYGLLPGLIDLIENIGISLIVLFCANKWLGVNLEVGVIYLFITYLRKVFEPIDRIIENVEIVQDATSSIDKIYEILEHEEYLEDYDSGIEIKDVKGKIEFKNVVFQYDNNDKPTIKDFTATALPGQKVAIVGPTGAGKTTMVNLLMKFYNINSGDIKIDGVSTKDLTRENIHDLFTMVLQDTWLFNGTIKENIIYNRQNVTDEMVKEVCKEVGLHHFIKTLPNGYDSKISDNDSVSAGQRQLLTIARGMIHDAPFLILDEATSNVDTRTEELVQKAMDKLTEGKTSFIIAHRLSTIKNADLILVMKDGNIIEQGNHEQLIAQKGFYADLYNSQFEL